MITKEELRKYAKQADLNLGQMEKNYLHIITLHAISKLFPEKLIFKGGTALMICHNLDRFSEDLDFTFVNNNLEDIIPRLVKFFRDQNQFIEVESEEKTEVSKKFTIRFHGPLFQGSRQTTCKIKIDISLREKIMKETKPVRIIQPYPDTPTFYLSVMSLEEMFAEKIRALIARNKARDLFDLDYLLAKKVKPDLNLIKKKLKYYDETFSKKKLIKAIEQKKQLWKTELKSLVSRTPDFNKVKKRLIKSFT